MQSIPPNLKQCITMTSCNFTILKAFEQSNGKYKTTFSLIVCLYNLVAYEISQLVTRSSVIIYYVLMIIG